jgi:predicted MFS family arabinose efflux permease
LFHCDLGERGKVDFIAFRFVVIAKLFETTGILNLVFATGSSAGAPLGGFLADTIGWRWFILLLHCLVPSTSNSSPRAFIIQSPAAILVLFTVSLVLHLPKSSESDFHTNLKRVDFSGAICLVLAVFLLLFGLDRGGNVSWTDTLTISTLTASLVLSVLFAFIEVTLASEPFAPRRIILNRSLTPSYLVNFFGMASALSLFFHVSLYLQAVHGKTATEAGLWLLPSIAGGVFGSVGGGLVMQSTGKYYFLTVGAYLILLVGTVVVVLPTGAAMCSAVGVALGTLCIFMAKCVADGIQA